MNYSIEVKKSVFKSLKKFPHQDQILISKRIQALAGNPRPDGVKKLVNSSYYRIRYGNYRIIYEIFDAKLVILVLKVGHRKDVYQ